MRQVPLILSGYQYQTRTHHKFITSRPKNNHFTPSNIIRLYHSIHTCRLVSRLSAPIIMHALIPPFLRSSRTKDAQMMGVQPSRVRPRKLVNCITRLRVASSFELACRRAATTTFQSSKIKNKKILILDERDCECNINNTVHVSGDWTWKKKPTDLFLLAKVPTEGRDRALCSIDFSSCLQRSRLLSFSL